MAGRCHIRLYRRDYIPSESVINHRISKPMISCEHLRAMLTLIDGFNPPVLIKVIARHECLLFCTNLEQSLSFKSLNFLR